MSNDENIMTLRTLITALETMAMGLGEGTLVDVDIEFASDDFDVVGKIQDALRPSTHKIVAIQPDKPVYIAHGERVVRERLQQFAYTAGAILSGMDGHPFVWTEEIRRWNSYKARRMGATLITRSFAQDLGLRVIDGQQPVGSGQFDWGRKRKPYGQLYVMECQMEKAPAGVSEGPAEESEEREGDS